MRILTQTQQFELDAQQLIKAIDTTEQTSKEFGEDLMRLFETAQRLILDVNIIANQSRELSEQSPSGTLADLLTIERNLNYSSTFLANILQATPDTVLQDTLDVLLKLERGPEKAEFILERLRLGTGEIQAHTEEQDN